MLSLKIIFRRLFRQKFSSLINILGLSVGIASFLLISLYVYDEYQYDRFHKNGEQIFRLSGNTFNPNSMASIMPLRFYPYIKERVPEAEAVVRTQAPFRDPSLERGDNSLIQPDVLFADPELLSVFCFDLIQGSVEEFAADHNGVLIGREVAKKLFDDEYPVGETIMYNGALPLVVRGILDDIPKHSHLQFSVLIHFEFLRSLNTFAFETWGNYSTTYYMLVQENADIPALESKLLNLFAEAQNVDYSDGTRHFYLQPLHDIYLGSALISSPTVPVLAGNQRAIHLFSLSAILILLLACFNYVNLASAKSTSRAREVGVRKVLGAGKKGLIRYFLFDSLLVTFISLALGMLMVEIALPYFSDFSGKDLAFISMPPHLLIIYLLLILTGVTLFSGLYPSMVVARFNPLATLKGSPTMISRNLNNPSGSGFRLRQLLIVLQFAISIGLVICSVVMYQQNSHVLKHNGFDSESLVVVRNITDRQITQRYNAFRTEMGQYPYVRQISAGTHVPTQSLGYMSRVMKPGQSVGEGKPVYMTYVDFGYFETLGARISSGRSFDRQNATDSTDVVIINRTAANDLGITEADGTMLRGLGSDNPKRLIGIVEDIHFRSVQEKVRSKAFFIHFDFQYQPPASFHMMIKYDNDDVAEVTQAIQTAWRNHAPEDAVLDYFFMDERYQSLYREEMQTSQVARIFTFLAILIAAMGLMGTTVYVMEARKKEFGIRKVLGASTARLSRMVSGEFSLLILIANIISWPTAFYFMSRWLDHFAYRIEISIWVFMIAGLLGLLMTLIIVNSLALNQAGKNPVEVLKYE